MVAAQRFFGRYDAAILHPDTRADISFVAEAEDFERSDLLGADQVVQGAHHRHVEQAVVAVPGNAHQMFDQRFHQASTRDGRAAPRTKRTGARKKMRLR